MPRRGEGAALFGIIRRFHTFGREAVDYSQHAAALIAFGDDGLDRVGGGAKNRADFGDVLDATQNVDRVALAHHDDEGVAGGDGRGVLRGQRFERVVIAVHAGEARARGFIEGDGEFHLRDGVYDGLVNILNGLDEVRLAQNQIAVFGDFERYQFQFHTKSQW